MICPLCRSNVRPYLLKDGYQYLRCSQCRFIFLESIPENIKDFYQSSYFNLADDQLASAYVNYEADKSVMNNFYYACLNELKKIINSSNIKLLDIGTATGHFLNLAQQKNIQAAGIELNQEMIRLGQQQGRPIYYGQLGKLSDDYLIQHKNNFDIISLWDVLEHLPDLDTSFQEINSLLKPHGLLIIATPDAGSLWARFFGSKWHSFVPPEHIIFFNQKNIKQFLESHGYQIIKIKTMHKTFSLPYIFNMAYRWLKFKPLSQLSHLTLKQKFLSKLTFKIPIGDNMLIIAQRHK